MEYQSLRQSRRDQQQRGDVLAADITFNINLLFLLFSQSAIDLKRREAFIFCILNICSKIAQCIYQYTDWALFHTFAACQYHFFILEAEICGQETHSSTRRTD